MASGYTRQSAADIQPGLAIQSSDINNEYNAIQTAFDNTLGHDHSGSVAGTGAKIPVTSISNYIAASDWVPADGSGAGLTITVNTAKYVKIGQIVIAVANITYPATANTASAQLSGLPALALGIPVGVNPGGGSSTAVTGLGTQVFFSVAPNSTTINHIADSSGVNKTNANLSGASIAFTIVYISAS